MPTPDVGEGPGLAGLESTGVFFSAKPDVFAMGTKSGCSKKIKRGRSLDGDLEAFLRSSQQNIQNPEKLFAPAQNNTKMLGPLLLTNL